MIQCQNCGGLKPKNIDQEFLHQCEKPNLKKSVWKPLRLLLTLLCFGLMILLAWSNPLVQNKLLFYIIAMISIVDVAAYAAKSLLS